MPKLQDIPKNMLSFLDKQIQNVGRKLKDPLHMIGSDKSLSEIVHFWDQAQEPIYVDKGIWLLIQPDSLSSGLTSHLMPQPLNWEAVMEMTAHPVLVFGNEPTVQKKMVPPIQLYKPGPSGFHAISNTFISFKEANFQLEDPRFGIINKVIPGSGDYKLRIKGIRLYGSGGEVVAQVKIQYNPLINLDDQPANMTVYFRGVPQYDPEKEVFTLRHLDYDLKTGDFLMQVADWIMKSDILKMLRKKARIPIGPKLDQLKDRMNVVFNLNVGYFSKFQTQVSSFRVLGAYVDQDGIQAQVSLDGDARLNLFCR